MLPLLLSCGPKAFWEDAALGSDSEPVYQFILLFNKWNKTKKLFVGMLSVLFALYNSGDFSPWLF